MTAWHDVEQAEPEFARRVRALFDAHRHKTIATLRADGSPRISGIETVFEDGELVFGSMPGARKGADLRRDPRFALHSATVDPVEGSEAQWPGEAKISGRAIAAGPITEGPDGDRFHADIAEVVHTHLNEAATMLVVEWWTPSRGLRRIERELDRLPERPHLDRARASGAYWVHGPDDLDDPRRDPRRLACLHGRWLDLRHAQDVCHYRADRGGRLHRCVDRRQTPSPRLEICNGRGYGLR
jgi:hypothetical protein